MLGSGYVNSLARPEGNTTGVSILVDEADGKRQDILIEAVPGLRLMAILIDVNYTCAAHLMNCKRRRAHTVSSFQLIVSPEPRGSRQLWMVRRDRGSRSAKPRGVAALLCGLQRGQSRMPNNCFKRNCDSPRMGNFLKIVSKLGSFLITTSPGQVAFARPSLSPWTESGGETKAGAARICRSRNNSDSGASLPSPP